MPDSDREQAIRLLRAELQREERRLAEFAARPPADLPNKAVLAQTKINIDELSKALAALGALHG